MFIPIAEEAERSLRDKFAAAKIPVRSTYSCEEVGCIATECKDCPENFHVAHSNVIVEVDSRGSVIVDGTRLGRVLVSMDEKRLLKRADGSVAPFLMKAKNILEIVKCDEYRIRQTELSTIEVEIGGMACTRFG
jgi:hypothetical protein